VQAPPVTVDSARLLRRLGELRAVGATAAGGVTREAFGPRDLAARELVRRWMSDAGMSAEVDAAANLIGRVAGDGRWIATGSHLDTVIDGGWLDGAYGVVAGIEVAAALGSAGLLRHGLLVVAFSNEEGARGTDGMTGSRAAVGRLGSDELRSTDDEDVTLAERLSAGGGNPEHLASAVWDASTIDSFVELHIEQGPVLHAEGAALGVVDAITGRQGFDVRVHGRPNHAGTTPMHLRHDALAAAAEVVLAVESIPERSDVRVATCGHLSGHPNLRNVVPGSALIRGELRDTDADCMDTAMTVLAADVQRIAADRSVDIDLRWGQRVEPTLCAPSVVSAARAAAQRSGLGWTTLPSGAGHDAQILGQTIRIGMIFVPSIEGTSHAPTEDTPPEHLVAGAQALLDTVLALDLEAS
jgi:allantoate deiminase